MSGRRTESLTLLVAGNKAGYYGVKLDKRNAKSKPYKAHVWRGGKMAHLGSFTTAEGAALCVARSPEGQAVAAARAAAAAPLTSEEARQQARAEGLTLRAADNRTGYFGVALDQRVDLAKPYHAQLSRVGKKVHLGYFATAEEAALCIARSPERRVAAGRAAAPAPLTSRVNGKSKPPPSIDFLEEVQEGAVLSMPLGALFEEEEMAPPMSPGAFFREEEEMILSLLLVKQEAEEHAAVVREEEPSDDRRKRRRIK